MDHTTPKINNYYITILNIKESNEDNDYTTNIRL